MDTASNSRSGNTQTRSVLKKYSKHFTDNHCLEWRIKLDIVLCYCTSITFVNSLQLYFLTANSLTNVYPNETIQDQSLNLNSKSESCQ